MQGLDHIFLHEGPPPVNLVADAKYGTAKLAVLADGTRQMSKAWIDKRLENAVDEDTFNLIKKKGYISVLAKVSSDGIIKFQLLDANGQVIGKFNHEI